MSQIVELIESKKNDIVSQISGDSRLSNINVDIIVTDGKHASGIKFDDNAGMWLPDSNYAVSLVVNKLKQEYSDASTSEPVLVQVKCSRKQDPAKKSEKQKDEKSAETVFAVEKPKYKLEDVILPEDMKKSINDAISTIENFDIVYNQWNFKSKEPSAKTNICFYGAPGTGKTMCAHAIADKLGKDILIASYADIQSEYVGVGPKNLKAVFNQAEEKNALLFFDEADSFLRKRTSDSSSSASMHYNSMTNEMMKHLEDFNGVVIFATNLTENTDEAFKTRLSFSIEFKVPDEECRAKIIERMIPEQVPLERPFTSDDYKEMSQVCDSFVGRDIRNAVKTVLSVGAQNHEYPFTKDAFVDGFKKYKENKNNFDNSTGVKKENNNPIDVYSANGCIHTLLSYVALCDGPETDKERECLKLFSKILGRQKYNVTNISDFPEFEEICHEVKDEKLKIKTLQYLAYFLAHTEQEESMVSYIDKVANQFKLNDTVLKNVYEYYNSEKEIENIKQLMFN